MFGRTALCSRFGQIHGFEGVPLVILPVNNVVCNRDKMCYQRFVCLAVLAVGCMVSFKAIVAVQKGFAGSCGGAR